MTRSTQYSRPDEPFPNFRASRTRDRRNIYSSVTSKLQSCERVGRPYSNVALSWELQKRNRSNSSIKLLLEEAVFLQCFFLAQNIINGGFKIASSSSSCFFFSLLLHLPCRQRKQYSNWPISRTADAAADSQFVQNIKLLKVRFFTLKTRAIIYNDSDLLGVILATKTFPTERSTNFNPTKSSDHRFWTKRNLSNEGFLRIC